MYGPPYKEIWDYFTNFQIRGNLLDLGCGQGRDALFCSSIGYQVTAVDNSKVGIKQKIDKAKLQGFRVDGIVANIEGRPAF